MPLSVPIAILLNLLPAGPPPPVLLLAPNLDDDDGDGWPDWEDFDGAEGDDDRHPLVVHAPRGARLVLRGDGFRVWWQGHARLGEGFGDEWLVPQGGRLELEVEAEGFLDRGSLEIRDRNGKVLRRVELRSASVRLPSPFQPVDRVWVSRLGDDEADNSGFVASVGELPVADIRVVDVDGYDDDRWMQDRFEVGWSTGDHNQLQVILESPWEGLDGDGGSFVHDILPGDRDTILLSPGEDSGTGFDAFGNLEVTPPLRVDGRDYPDGRIVLGRGAEDGPSHSLLEFLAEVTEQDPVTIELDWLCVGHIDEVLLWLPDPSAPRGLRVLLPSPTLALDLLLGMPPETALPHVDELGYSEGPHRTVGELLADRRLVVQNRRIQRVELPALRAELELAFGVTPDEIRVVPALWTDRGEGADGCGFVSILPNLVNSVLINGEHPVLLAPDPRVRAPGDPIELDPFAAALRAAVPAGIEVHFGEVWDAYHSNLGAAHCGTQVRRRPR